MFRIGWILPLRPTSAERVGSSSVLVAKVSRLAARNLISSLFRPGKFSSSPQLSTVPVIPVCVTAEAAGRVRAYGGNLEDVACFIHHSTYCRIV